MEFRPARLEELESVHALYKSVLGEPFCLWDPEYPGWERIRGDHAARNLYLLLEDGVLAGAISIVPENDLEQLPCWSPGPAGELARVVVARRFRGRGLAGQMVRRILPILAERGLRWVRLSVGRDNLPARRTYEHCGFQTVGQAELYGSQFLLMERGVQPFCK